MNNGKKAQESPDVEPVWDQVRSARDEAGAAGTSGDLHGISGADWIAYGAIAAIGFGIAIVNALSAAHDAAGRGAVYDVRAPLLWEMTSIVGIILAALILFVAVRRMRLARGWLLQAGLAATAIVAFSALHIAVMVGLRKAVMLLRGGSYDFGLSAATLIYEFRKDVMTGLLIGGTLWLIDSCRETRRSRPGSVAAPAEPPPHMVWLRDGSTRIRIEPRDILWIGSAGNYVEYSLADGVSHLVRGTLAAEEARLAPYQIVRVHRTRLVNRNRVIEFRPGANGDFELTLDTGQTVGGSRRYRDALDAIERLAADSTSAPGDNPAHP